MIHSRSHPVSLKRRVPSERLNISACQADVRNLGIDSTAVHPLREVTGVLGGS